MKANGKPPCSGQGNRGFDSLHSDFLNQEKTMFKPNFFLVFVVLFLSLTRLSSVMADKRLSELERFKLAIDIATKENRSGILICRKSSNLYLAQIITRSIDGGFYQGVEHCSNTPIQAVDGLMRLYENAISIYPEPRVMGYNKVEKELVKEGSLYLFDDISLEKPQLGTVKQGKILLLGETEYRDILNTVEIYYARQ